MRRLLFAATTFAKANAFRGAIKPRPIIQMSTWTAAMSDIGNEVTKDVMTNLDSVRARVALASEGRSVTLVAVSKTKPLSLIAAAANAGHRDFGENYVQELVEKAMSIADANDDVAKTVRWHFIGRLQSNKVKALCSIPNLYAVHTVHSEKIANALQKNWLELQGPEAPRLDVFIQVNTSGEDSKGGCAPADAPQLAQAVKSCPNLNLIGLMCIGKYSGAEGDASPDFIVLNQCRAAAAEALGVDEVSMALSMGMSHDFETAIKHGATHVRVGSTIFGARVYDKLRPVAITKSVACLYGPLRSSAQNDYRSI